MLNEPGARQHRPGMAGGYRWGIAVPKRHGCAIRLSWWWIPRHFYQTVGVVSTYLSKCLDPPDPNGRIAQQPVFGCPPESISVIVRIVFGEEMVGKYHRTRKVKAFGEWTCRKPVWVDAGWWVDMNTQKNVKTDAISTFYYKFSILFHSQVKWLIHDASAKKGIHLMHSLTYIYFVLKDFFLIVLKLQKSLPSAAKKWLMFWG